MKLSEINELTIGIVLVVVAVCTAILVIVSGADSLAATGFRDLLIALAGGLLGSKVPRPPA